MSVTCLSSGVIIRYELFIRVIAVIVGVRRDFSGRDWFAPVFVFGFGRVGDVGVIAFAFGLWVLVRVAVLVNTFATEAYPSAGRVTEDFGTSLLLLFGEVSLVFECSALVAIPLAHAKAYSDCW